MSYITRVLIGIDLCFFFNDTATTEIYTLSLHDALPIYKQLNVDCLFCGPAGYYRPMALVSFFPISSVLIFAVY